MQEKIASHTVHEAIGPDLSARQTASALSFGVVSLLFAGVLPALLGALIDEHRLSEQGLALCAALEALTMGASTSLAAIVLPPRRLKLIGVATTLALAALDFLPIGAGETAVLVCRALAGLCEGVLLWISVGMIARSELPERWAGVFFVALTSAQLVLALAFAFWVIPLGGADGGFIALGLATLFGVLGAFYCPDRYGVLPGSEGAAGSPPLRGWVALFAILLYVAAGAAVGPFLEPIAHQAGLNGDIARTAIWVSLAAQIGGGAAATALAGHLRYLTAFVVGSAFFLANWAILADHPPAWLFVSSNMVAGFFSVFIAPFLVPMTIEADPSRKAAVQNAGAQLLASALGPFLARFTVSEKDVHGVFILGTSLLLAGLAVIAGLHIVAVRERARLRTAAPA